MKTYEERLPLIDKAIESLIGFDEAIIGGGGSKDNYLWVIGGRLYQKLPKPNGYEGEWICTRTEFNQRKEQLQNKPSWDGAPEWAKWLCQNHKGEWIWFSVEPQIMGNIWCFSQALESNGEYDCGFAIDFGKGLFVQTVEQGKIIGNWQDTLEVRPTLSGFDGDAEPLKVADVTMIKNESDGMYHITIKSDGFHIEKEKPIQNVKALLKDGMRCVDDDNDIHYVCGSKMVVVSRETPFDTDFSDWTDDLKGVNGNLNDIMRIIDRDDTVVWEREEVKRMTKAEAEAVLTDALHVKVEIV